MTQDLAFGTVLVLASYRQSIAGCSPAVTLSAVPTPGRLRSGNFFARDGEFYPYGPVYQTISLGEPYDGFCYKIVDAVIPD